jgi:flagellar biosynthesis/type III secretory pathway protein FliH
MTTPAPATHKHTCAELGICQWRNPPCVTCPSAPPVTAARSPKLPVWAQRLLAAATFGIACFALGYAQTTDEQWREIDLAAAQAKGYQAGYNKGSSAALKAMHLKCIDQTYLEPLSMKTMTQVQVAVCDKALAEVVVAYADGVQ